MLTPNNPTPITDAALAELKRLHAAATPGEWRRGGVLYTSRDNACSIVALHNAFFSVIARLEAAEREREAAKAEVARQWITLTEIAELVEDYADCDDDTDAAHPAWWRGNDYGVAQICRAVNDILDGKDISGVCGEPWESTRRLVAEARKDGERLDWCSKHGSMAVEWWQGGYRVVTHHNVWRTDAHDTPRAAIDAARGAK